MRKGGLCVFLGLLVLAECAEPPCSQPQTIEHGITDWDGKSKLANFACYQGYHLVGPPSVECRYGDWYSDAPATYPTCKPIVCNYPVIQNGHLETGDNVRYRSGTQASIECEDGYELRSGHAGIICKEDGSWQPINQKEFPLCKEKACQYPDSSIPVIENGSLEINGNRQGPNSGYKPGSVAVYHCHPGYVLLPFSAGKLVCQRGIWEGSIPACVSPQSKPVPRRSHCPSPTSIPNGYYITDTDSDTPLALPVSERGQYERGTIARYHCQEGYILRTYQGQDTYRCMANGIWSPKVPPVCIKLEQNTFQDPLDEVMCPSPAQIANTDFERMEGWLTSNGAIHGTVLEYSCSIGYRDSRTPCLPTRRTCHAGKWVGNMPACVPFDFCERPPSISHGFMVTSPENIYRIWTEVYYECHQGYQMKGVKSLKCHPTGCWTPNDLPQCVREDLIDSNWSDSDSGSLPLVISLVTVSTGLAVIALFTTSCLVVLCRRKGGPVPHHGHAPAHWSTTVTVTPDCRSNTATRNEQMLRRHEQDRMALIAFADGMQQVSLPSYEEALRDNATSSNPGGSGVNINHTVPNAAAALETTATNSQPTVSETIITELDVPTRSSGNGSSHIHYNNNMSTTSCNYRRYQQNRSGISRSGRSRHRGRDFQEIESNVHGWTRPQPHPRSTRRTTGASSSISSGGSPRENNHDALSDTVSHHSVSSAGVNWSSQRQTSTSIRSGSAASVEAGTHVILSKEPSESTLTTTDNGNSSQTPSCRALAGSLASFDNSSIVAEGVPLLEENEMETEGSNSSEQGDTGSATYSETSNKT